MEVKPSVIQRKSSTSTTTRTSWACSKKNKKKLTIDPARREPAEALRAELGASVGKLVPSMEQIERTDELIDAIVYRLYGLSEEEIRIVEGK